MAREVYPVRLPDDLAELVEKDAEPHGRGGVSKVLREIIADHYTKKGKVEYPTRKEVVELTRTLCSVRDNLYGLGSNLNQIAYHCNRIITTDEYLGTMKAELLGLLNSLLARSKGDRKLIRRALDVRAKLQRR